MGALEQIEKVIKSLNAVAELLESDDINSKAAAGVIRNSVKLLTSSEKKREK